MPDWIGGAHTKPRRARRLCAHSKLNKSFLTMRITRHLLLHVSDGRAGKCCAHETSEFFTLRGRWMRHVGRVAAPKPKACARMSGETPQRQTRVRPMQIEPDHTRHAAIERRNCHARGEIDVRIDQNRTPAIGWRYVRRYQGL